MHIIHSYYAPVNNQKKCKTSEKLFSYLLNSTILVRYTYIIFILFHITKGKL